MAETLQAFSVLRFTEDGRVWGSTREELEQLPLLEQTLASLEDSQLQPITFKVYNEGDWCLVQHKQGVWQRGEVVTLLSGQLRTLAEILLIDEGSQVTVPISSCFTLPVSVRQVPPLVNCYSLKGISPSKSGCGSWSEEVMELLLALNGDCTLDVLLEPEKLATLYLGAGTVEESFNECLVHAAKAMPSPVESSQPGAVEIFLPTEPTVERKARNADKRRQFEVYVEGGQDLLPWSTLGVSSFPGSVQNGLLSLGFQTPTTAQAHAWPYVWDSHNVVLVSPPSTGKTLSYLLPLLAAIGPLSSEGPALLIVVETSWQAKSAHIQAKRILSWTSAQAPLRCCCTYAGLESEAVVSLINGVDVLISTPPSITRLVGREALSLKCVRKLVLDDVCALSAKFSDELGRIISDCHSSGIDQVVLTSSDWSSLLPSLCTALCPAQPVTIITSATEALVKCHTTMNVACCGDKERLLAVVDHLTRGGVVVCTSSPEEALAVQQVAQLHSCVCLNVLSQWDCDKITTTLTNAGTVVICDEVLRTVLAEGLLIHCLVQYSLPRFKAVFQQRLALLYPSLLKCVPCEWSVLVTDDDASRCALFIDLLQRTSQTVPGALKDLAEKHQQELDKQRSGYDLCYHLKAWGVCSVEKCPSLHAPSPQTPHTTRHSPLSLQLPTSGTLEVRVSHVSNATRLWVTVLKHYPEKRGGACYDVTNQTTPISLPLKLSHYYSTPENKLLKYNVSEGVYCALEDVDGSYHRVRVLKFSHPLGFCFPHKEKARVRLIDHGSVLVVDLNQLLELPAEFLCAPAAVSEVFLCGVRPVERDRDWPLEALEFSCGLLEGEVIVGRVAAHSGSCLWLDPVEYRVSLPRLNVTTALCNPVKELIKAGFGERNLDHLPRLRAALNEPSLPTPHLLCSSLPGGEESTEVCVSAVCSPSLLYLQLVENNPQLNELEDILNSANILALTTVVLRKGDHCAAQFPLDQRWYRGLIREKREGECEVFFIDHGDTEWVEDGLVQPIDQSCLELPAQAIICSLTSTDMSWSESSGDKLWDLTKHTNFIAKVTGSLSDSNSIPVVSLTHPTTRTDLFSHFLEQTKTPSPPKSPLYASLLTELVTGLTGSTVTQHQFALLLEHLLITNPKYIASNFQELTPLLTDFERVETQSAVHLVRGLSAASQWLAGCLKDLDWIGRLLKRDESLLVDSTIQLLKLTLFHAQHEIPDTIFHTLLFLLDTPSAARRTAIIDLFLLTPHNLLATWDRVGRLTEVCCNCLLEESAVMLSCLHLLNSLSMYKEPACVIRGRLSGQVLTAAKHTHRALESLESGSLLVNMLWKLSNSEPWYCDQVCACYWEAPHCHFFIKTLFKAKFGVELNIASKMAIKPDAGCTVFANKQTLVCPRVLWSQQKSSVLLAVQLRDCPGVHVEFKERGVTFKAELEEQLYGFDLALCDSISVLESAYVVCATEVLITLHKEHSGYWSHLTDKANKLPMFSTDFDRCQGDSDEDESFVSRPVVPVRTHLFESSSEEECSDIESNDFI